MTPVSLLLKRQQVTTRYLPIYKIESIGFTLAAYKANDRN